MFQPAYETIHLAGMNFSVVCEGAAGAPAFVILPNDSDTQRVLQDDDLKTLWCN